MRFVFTSYVVSKNHRDPEAWLKHINFYIGALEALSANHEVISIEQIDYEGEYTQNGVYYYFERFGHNNKFPLQQHLFIKSLKPDVVFVQSLHFPLQVIQLRLLLGSKVKIIIQNHAEKPFGGLKKRALRLADKFTNAYLFASKPMGLDWVTNGNLSSTEKIHEVMEVSSVFYPTDKAIAKQKTGITGNLIYLWVGRLNDNKDPLNVVKAFLRFAATEPGARLYMIYQTTELLPQIQELLNNSPYSHAVTLVGKLPNSELLHWFNSADFMLSGSHYEGSGSAVCQAMSCGCIPVVTDIQSFRMITDNGRCGLLYPPGDEDALLSALLKTRELDQGQLREDVLAYFKSTLSFEAIAQKIQAIASSC